MIVFQFILQYRTIVYVTEMSSKMSKRRQLFASKFEPNRIVRNVQIFSFLTKTEFFKAIFDKVLTRHFCSQNNCLIFLMMKLLIFSYFIKLVYKLGYKLHHMADSTSTKHSVSSFNTFHTNRERILSICGQSVHYKLASI